jgi:4'-phosphopantetheinyl transferase
VQAVEIEIWTIRPAGVDDFASSVSEAERTRAGAFAGETRRMEFLAGRALARAALARRVGGDPRRLEIVVDDAGRPSLAGAGVDGPFFSIAHCRGLVACALAEVPVGLDAEHLARIADPAEFGRRYFRPEEAVAVTASASPREIAVRLFTLKEAFSKAVGLGLALPLADTRFENVIGDAPRLADVSAAFGPASAWRAAIADRGGGIVVTVVARTGGRPLDLRLRPARGSLLGAGG